MTRTKAILTAIVAAATAMLPAGAQTVHFVGAGSSSQYQLSALAAYHLAQSEISNLGLTGTKCAYHFTNSGSAVLTDPRNAAIPTQSPTLWVVWIADCAGSGSNVTDLWLDGAVDSVVGVTSVSLIGPLGRGAQITLPSGATASGLVNSALWGDSSADVSPIPASVTSAIDANGGLQVNAALTDIRPEDALFATNRALAKLNTVDWSGLGYIGSSKGIGASIHSFFSSAAVAPVLFGLSGTADPLSPSNPKGLVPPLATLPVGAAPIYFVTNNSTGTPYALNANNFTSSPTFDLAHLFDGTTHCGTSNPTFTGGLVAPNVNLTVLLREPISGTMNTAEFTEFRTVNNSADSQEKGVIAPLNIPYNPLNLTCAGGGGKRERALSTGEVVSHIKSLSYSIGYAFGGFSNTSVLATLPVVNYLTLDGVDPIGIATTNQELPACTTTTAANNCGAANVTYNGVPVTSQWPGQSYPSLRDGSYSSWSMYRWVGEPGGQAFCLSNSTDAYAQCNAAPSTYSGSSYPNIVGAKTTTANGITTVTVSVPGPLGPYTQVGTLITLAGVSHMYGSSTQSYDGTFTITNVKSRGTFSSIYFVNNAFAGFKPANNSTSGFATVSPFPADAYGVEALAQSAQDLVDVTVADFVPFNTSASAPYADGLDVYRSHFTQSGVAPDNGPLVTTPGGLTRGGGTEAGGDMGGCIVVNDTPSNELNCRQ